MELRLDYFMEALPVMGIGLLGIFVVTGVIIGAVSLLNYLTAKR